MDYKADVKLMKALADENRLAILHLLQSGEKCACVLLEDLQITQPTLSHHMKILCDANIVSARKDGKWMHYSISEEGSQQLMEMIRSYTFKEESKASCSSCCKTD